MRNQLVTREMIIAALRNALEPLPYVHALWEGGAAAFKRADEWSDLDLQVDVEDGRATEIFPLVEQALGALSPIELRHETPQPAWHGHLQVFYRLRDASPFLLVDFVVIKHSNPNKFLEREIHGEALVHFDKSGVVNPPPLDREQFKANLRKRVETASVLFSLFQTLALKELYRRNHIEALSFYQGFTLRPLVEFLRIKHTPFHYNFHTRYLYYELPREIVEKLEPLFFIKDADDLRAKREEAEWWFHALLSELSDEMKMGDLG